MAIPREGRTENAIVYTKDAAGVIAAVASDNGLPVTPAALPSGTDRSGSIAAGGTAQVLAAENTARKGLVGQNIGNADLWLNEIGGTATADTAGSYRVASGEQFSVSTSRAISIVGATTGQKFTATEF